MKKVILVGIGAGIGAAQTIILREYVDKQYGSVIPQIGNWGNPSVLAGVGIGGVATALGALGMVGKGPIKSETTATSLVAYGISALVGGVLSALYPVTAGAGLGAPALKLVTAPKAGLVATKTEEAVI